MARHRVVLVRQWDQQMGGSGCCGRISSEAVRTVTDIADDPYEYCRPDMERMGSVYRALRARFDEDEVDLTVVDPRNTAWILPAIWRDARRRGLSVRETLKQINAATTARALVCDGKLIAVDLDPDQAVAAVEADFAERADAH